METVGAVASCLAVGVVASSCWCLPLLASVAVTEGVIVLINARATGASTRAHVKRDIARHFRLKAAGEWRLRHFAPSLKVIPTKESATAVPVTWIAAFSEILMDSLLGDMGDNRGSRRHRINGVVIGKPVVPTPAFPARSATPAINQSHLLQP